MRYSSLDMVYTKITLPKFKAQQYHTTKVGKQQRRHLFKSEMPKGTGKTKSDPLPKRKIEEKLKLCVLIKIIKCT